VFCPAPNGAGCVLKTARSAGGILASAEGAESKFLEIGAPAGRAAAEREGSLAQSLSPRRSNWHAAAVPLYLPLFSSPLYLLFTISIQRKYFIDDQMLHSDALLAIIRLYI
jgi:hypothetical protein